MHLFKKSNRSANQHTQNFFPLDEKGYNLLISSQAGINIDRFMNELAFLPKSGHNGKFFPGLVALLTDNFRGIKDLSKIVIDYALKPLITFLSPELIASAHYIDSDSFKISGCDYVGIQWCGGQLNLPYSNFGIFLEYLYELLTEEPEICAEKLQTNLTVSFYGNITEINIHSCNYITDVVDFPDLALLKKLSFMCCNRLKSVPQVLPLSVMSLECCFRGIDHTVENLKHWDTSRVMDFSNTYASYGGEMPPLALNSAISIAGMFQHAINITVPEQLFLYLPVCLSATKAFHGTTNLGGEIVIYAPKLQICDDMFREQSEQTGHILLIASPKLIITDTQEIRSGFFSNNVGLDEAFEATLDSEEEPEMKELKRPVIITAKEVSKISVISEEETQAWQGPKMKKLMQPIPEEGLPKCLLKIGEIPKRKFLFECTRNAKVVHATPLEPITTSGVNYFGQGAKLVCKPSSYQVFMRKHQPGVVVSEEICKNLCKPPELTDAIVSDITEMSIRKFFEDYVCKVSYLYGVTNEELLEHLFN